MENVSKRVYRGYCIDTVILRGALRHITQKENEIGGIMTDLPLFSSRGKEKRIGYLRDFFTHASEEDKMISAFEKRCHP